MLQDFLVLGMNVSIYIFTQLVFKKIAPIFKVMARMWKSYNREQNKAHLPTEMYFFNMDVKAATMSLAL